MKCEEVQLELVSYQFGTVSEQSRADIDSHLLSCGSCLRNFLELKREIETGRSGPRPSAAARSRLRAAVATQVNPLRGAKAWSWWERPLAFGLAAAAVVAATVTTNVVTSRPGTPPHGLLSSSEPSGRGSR